MKKYTPYIFPLVVVGIVFLLVFRWYNMRTQQAEEQLFGEGVQIENLSEDEVRDALTGVGDYETVALSQDAGATQPTTGEIKYEIRDDKVRFTVSADLDPTTGPYQVWLKESAGEAKRLAFTLEEGKAGLFGSAALPANLLPFEVLVTKQSTEDEPAVLRGTIPAPAADAPDKSN